MNKLLSLTQRSLSVLLFVIIMAGCNNSPVEVITSNNAFNFLLPERIENRFYNSDVKKKAGPGVYMYYGEERYDLDSFKSRGRGTLSFKRKSFAVNVDGRLVIPNRDSTGFEKFNKFKLLAMPFDYTYIENRLSHLLLAEAGIWNLRSFYTEVRLNNRHQGLYMFVEDPEEYAIKRCKAHFVMRRGARNSIDSYELNDNSANMDPGFFTGSFMHIYDLISELSGELLYDSLSSLMNIDDYMKKIALDYILENGDTSDEVYFYTIGRADGSSYFDIIPWDYDDIFNTKPHEVGRVGSTGENFGVRDYPTLQALQEAIDGRMVYSVEDDLEYVIAKDDFLYARYLEIMNEMVHVFDADYIENIFIKIRNELDPYYAIPEVVEQSAYDVAPTSYEAYNTNLTDKKLVLNDRLEQIRSMLDNQ